MDRYIALKPVRFDRDYAAGETIPADVVDPKGVKRLIDWGKIQRVTEPDAILGDDPEKAVAFLEEILGIDHGDAETVPDVEARAATCKETIIELQNATALLQAQGEKDDGQDGDIPESGIAFVEGLLGITYHGGTIPLTKEERTEAVKAVIADLLAVKQDNKDGQDETDETPENEGEREAPKTPADDAECEGGTNIPPDPENEQDGQPDGESGGTGTPANIQTVNLTTGTGAATDTKPPEGGGLPDMVCPVCGRVMGSRAALTSHIKKEHPEYKA